MNTTSGLSIKDQLNMIEQPGLFTHKSSHPQCEEIEKRAEFRRELLTYGNLAFGGCSASHPLGMYKNRVYLSVNRNRRKRALGFVQIAIAWTVFGLANIAILGFQLGEKLAMDHPELWINF